MTDLGADVKPEAFLEAVKKTNANIVAFSAMLTVTMLKMKSTIEALKAAGLRDRVKVIIGGAPIGQPYCDEIGADAYKGQRFGGDSSGARHHGWDDSNCPV